MHHTIKLITLLFLSTTSGLTIKSQQHRIVGVVTHSPLELRFYLHFRASKNINFYTFEANHAGKCIISNNFDYYKTASIYNDTFTGTLITTTLWDVNCFAFSNEGPNNIDLEYLLIFNTEKIWGGKLEDDSEGDDNIKIIDYDGRTGFGVLYGIFVLVIVVIVSLILI